MYLFAFWNEAHWNKNKYVYYIIYVCTSKMYVMCGSGNHTTDEKKYDIFI